MFWKEKAGAPRSLGFGNFYSAGFAFYRLLRSDRKSGPHFLCREKVTKSGRGAPRAPVRGDSHPAGGCRPGLPLDSRPNPGLHWPPGRIGAPCATGPGRGASAQPATGRGRFWADVSPWVGCRKSICPGAQKAAWNRCESSGGPGCRAPREAWRFAELPTALPGGERRLGTVHETSGGPSRSHPAQPVALEGSRGLPGQSLATFF